MSLKKSELVSAFGTAFEVFKALCNAVMNLGGNDEWVRRILSEPTLAEEIAMLLNPNPSGQELRRRFLRKQEECLTRLVFFLEGWDKTPFASDIAQILELGNGIWTFSRSNPSERDIRDRERIQALIVAARASLATYNATPGVEKFRVDEVLAAISTSVKGNHFGDLRAYLVALKTSRDMMLGLATGLTSYAVDRSKVD